jgi:DNA polymerase III subunit beta
MEFKVQKKDILKGLERTLTVVERRNTMPSLNHSLIEVKDNFVQISATDLEIFVSSTIACQTLETGRIAIPAKAVFEIVKECQADSDVIHFKETEGHRMEIRAGKSLFKILGLSSDSFPHFKTSPKGQLTTAHLNCSSFLKLLQKTEHAICHEEIRYFLTGIYLETVENKDGGLIRAVSTDGHRLAVQDANQKDIGALSLKKGLIIPKKGAAELRKLLESTSEETFEFVCDDNLIKVNVADHNLWIRPIDGEFPDYKRVIPQNLPASLDVEKRDLAASLRRMSLLVSDRSKVVSFDFKKEKIVFSTINPDIGEATDEVPVKYSGDEFKTGFNVRFFTEALANLDGDDIKIQVGEKLMPALLSSEANPGYQIVIMPMRI